MWIKGWVSGAALLMTLSGVSIAHAEVGDLGIAGLECDCTYIGGEQLWSFRSAPRVLAVLPWQTSGLRAGDVVLSIDGHALTSPEGGRRFARLVPGTQVELAVRRGDRVQTLRVEVHGVPAKDALIARAPRVPRAPRSAEGVPPPPAAPEPEWRSVGQVPPVPPGPAFAPPVPDPSPTPAEILPEGSFGFAIECFPCSGGREEGVLYPVWAFGKPPRVYSVTPGSPAAHAGLRRGDQLTHMDGVALTTPEGGRRFGTVKPGQKVTWRVKRDGQNLTMPITAEKRAAVLAAPPAVPAAPRAPKTLRYAARFGDNEIEVRGSSSVIISEDDEKGEIVITSDGVTVRVRKRSK